MGLFWPEAGTIELKMLLGVGGLIVALIVFVYTNRTEKLVGVPVMTGYGMEHERAMMEGALKVSLRINIFVSTCSLNSTLYSIRQLLSLLKHSDLL